MKMKRITAAILAIAQIAAFTGCSKSEENKTTTAIITTETTTKEPTETTTTEITTQEITELTTVELTTQETTIVTMEKTSEEELNLDNLIPFDMSKDNFMYAYNENMLPAWDYLKIKENNVTEKNNKLIIAPVDGSETILYLSSENKNEILSITCENKVNFSDDFKKANLIGTLGNIFTTLYFFTHKDGDSENLTAEILMGFIFDCIDNATNFIEIEGYEYSGEYDKDTEILKVIVTKKKTS